jgi:MoaA/NifB/PqqE/SkfB family radical SAM enzyme
MNKELPNIIKWFQSHNPNISIDICTNGGVQKPNWWIEIGKLLKQKGKVVFAIDGLEDTNHIYRINVKWDKILENIKAYISTGASAEWQFIPFKHNDHQVDECRALSKELGFNKFFIKPSHRNITNQPQNEKNKILTMTFEDLWCLLWGEYSNNQYRSEETSSKEKFELLKRGIKVRNNEYSIKSLIDSSTTIWSEPEWGFPKGRRNYQEKDIDCGIREFLEETGYGINDFKLIENIIPYEEIFIGSNIKSYKHKYYLACMTNNTLDIQDYQKSEVKNIKWMSFDECLNYIRPYNLEKINIIEKINKVLQEYRLY